MGVENLWLLLSPAATKIPESRLCSKRLGIDISIWVLRILHGYLSISTPSFQNIHLLGVFKRILRLLSLEIKPIFVFDGKAPDLKRKTLQFRSQSRQINVKKLAEKLLVQQIEGKTLKIKPNLKDSRDSDTSEEEIEVNREENPDLLQIFEADIEEEAIKELLRGNSLSFSEFSQWDYVKRREYIKKLREKALEKKHELFAKIDDKSEFSRVQIKDYLSLIENKRKIEEMKKNVAKTMNCEILEENLLKMGGVKGFDKEKVRITKDFVVMKREVDPQVERMRILMSRVEKPKRKNKKEKEKEFQERIEKFIDEKQEIIQKKQKNEKFIEENIQKKDKKEVLKEKADIIEKSEGKSDIIEKSEEKADIIDKSEERFDIIDKSEEKADIIVPEKSVEKVDFPEKKALLSLEKDDISEDFPIPLSKTSLDKFESLHKDFHSSEMRRMLSSSRTSRSSSQSRPTPSLNPLSLESPTKKPLISQEEILEELEKMDVFPIESESEISSNLTKLTNLNSLNDSMASKFEQIKHLLRLFGIPWVESPFEAEAQCAYLEINGLIDGSITEDSDIFLFGGRKVYRKVFSNCENTVDYYEMGKIEKNLGLNREKLISLALFLGSDYTIGVKGVGIVNAMEIVNAFETIESLERFKAWAEKPDVLLEDKESFYHNISLKELQYKHFHKNYKKNWEFPDEFPDYQVVEGYKSPGVDESKERFVWGVPDIEGLKKLCQEEFGWDQQKIDEVGFELGRIVKKMKGDSGQMKIDEFFKVEKGVGEVKSRRLKIAIKGMKAEEEEIYEELKEKEKGELEELEILNSFNYKRRKL